MFFKATRTQTVFLLRQKGAIFTLYILLAIVLSNFIENVMDFQGMEIVEMYHPMKLLLLSYNKVPYKADLVIIFTQLFPLLVVGPAGFSLAIEQQSGEDAYIITRLGHLKYKLSKLLAAFFATAIVVSLPFFIEIILNCISFPLEATGDLFNGPYNQEYIDGVKNYWMPEFYSHAPYLYTVVGTLFFAFVSGVLGAFTVAFSSIVKVKYRIFLFLPVFSLLNATVYFSILEKISASSRPIIWSNYILLFYDHSRELVLMGVIFVLFILFSFVATIVSSRKECF